MLNKICWYIFQLATSSMFLFSPSNDILILIFFFLIWWAKGLTTSLTNVRGSLVVCFDNIFKLLFLSYCMLIIFLLYMCNIYAEFIMPFVVSKLFSRLTDISSISFFILSIFQYSSSFLGFSFILSILGLITLFDKRLQSTSFSI